MNLRDLEYLVALSEHRHFGRAAAACFVSQPTLSTQVRKLENELGVPLIERSSRGVLLTPAGRQIVLRAKGVLSGADDIRGIARQALDPRSGTVRLGVFPTLAPYLLPHAVPRLTAALPDLRLLLVEEKTHHLAEELRGGQLDAAVLALPVDDSFEVAPLFRESFVLAVPTGHPLAAGEGLLRSDDLGGHDVLLLAEGHCLRDQALDVCTRSGAREREEFRATSLETLRHMVAAGVGITLMPYLSVVPPVPDYAGIALRRFADPAPHRDIALVWRRAGVHGELMTELADLVRAAVGEGAGHGVSSL